MRIECTCTEVVDVLPVRDVVLPVRDVVLPVRDVVLPVRDVVLLMCCQ